MTSEQLQPISVTASGIATFEDCQARYWHDQQRYPDTLPTDRVAADVGTAIHDALLQHQNQLEQAFRQGAPPTPEVALDRLRGLTLQQLRRRRLNHREPAVKERLARLAPGIKRAAALLLDDMNRWVYDSERKQYLVWAEAWLDHGPAVRAVELLPGYLVRTKPDVIGVRPSGAGRHRIVVRDFKTRGEVVDPAFEVGIQIRAIWAALELRDSRCAWFEAARTDAVDLDVIELETVNLMFGDGDEFLIAATKRVEELFEERDRLVEVLREIRATEAETDPLAVLANPGGLCLNWCPHLNRCEAGQLHVRKYSGDDVLEARLAAATGGE